MPDWLWGALSAATIAGTIEFARVVIDQLSKKKNNSDAVLFSIYIKKEMDKLSCPGNTISS